MGVSGPSETSSVAIKLLRIGQTEKAAAGLWNRPRDSVWAWHRMMNL